MPTLRSLVTNHCVDDIPSDYDTNTVYHTVGSVGGGILPVDAQNHADEILAAFKAFPAYGARILKVSVYDMADAKPRPVLATAVFNPSSPDHQSTLGPRQVAVVLSFYADRNLPRQRGHIYLGPFGPGEGIGALRPGGIVGDAITLGDALFNIGGENVAHVVYSPTGNTTHVVKNYWCDDSWDTQRRRKSLPTSRQRSSH